MAATVVIQVGQCGNQLGCEFFSTLLHDFRGKQYNRSQADIDFHSSLLESFFEEESDGTLVARAILVDTEPKVIQHVKNVAKRSGTWSYPNNIYMRRQGAGNNWAYGYCSHGSSSKEQILNLAKSVVERTDNFVGFIIIMSLAGGTGSGLGTYLTEILRDEYPQVPIINVVIWPFNTGEVAVQSYNSILSLSRLQAKSSAIISIENEQLHRICTRRLGLKEVTINDMNAVAAQNLAGLFLPSCGDEGAKTNIGMMVNHLVPHPNFKLLAMHSVPQEPLSALPYDTATWPSLIRSLQRTIFYNAMGNEGLSLRNKTRDFRPAFISNLLVARGKDSSSVDCRLLSTNSVPYVTWTSVQDQPKIWCSHRQFMGYQKWITLACNSNTVINTLDPSVEKAWNMFLAKAYVFQYERYGLSMDDFLQSFISVEHIIASYKHLRSS